MTDLKVDTFEELDTYLDMFKKKHIDLLVVKGAPGVGKSYQVQRAVDNRDHLFINTHATPLQAYKLLYDFKDEPIVIDDITTLLKNDKLRSMFKQAGETNSVKHVEWNSTTNRLDGYPQDFDTESNLCLISNKVDESNDIDKLALLDRGFCLEFAPNKEELLGKMREITRKRGLEDKWKVYRFVKGNYSFSENVNLRTLVKGFQLLEYGRGDWKEILKEEMEVSEDLKRVKELLEKHETVTDAIEEYDKSKPTFHKYKRKLRKKDVL